MKTYTYIQKSAGYFDIDAALDAKVYHVGETWEDYLDGAWVLLSDGQLDFREANPAASIKEVFEMELAPPPPEPTIEELKAEAIAQIEQQAENRLKEAYPPEVLISKAYSKDADDNAFYFDGFMDFSERVENASEKAINDIKVGKDGKDINEAVEVFKQSIFEL